MIDRFASINVVEDEDRLMARKDRGERAGRLWKPALGLLLAPALPLLPFGVLSSNDMAWVAVVAYAMFGYPIALVLGLPVHLLLKRHDRRSIWHYMGFGGLIGLVTCVALMSLIRGVEPLSAIGLFVGYGAIAGLIFWTIAISDIVEALFSNLITRLQGNAG